MEALGYFLFWAGLVFLVVRLGSEAQVMRDVPGPRRVPEKASRVNPKQLGWTAPKTAVDPVCGTTVQTNVAKSSVDDGAVHYFCSRDCRERFEAAPKLYLGQPPEAPPEAMSHG